MSNNEETVPHMYVHRKWKHPACASPRRLLRVSYAIFQVIARVYTIGNAPMVKCTGYFKGGKKGETSNEITKTKTKSKTRANIVFCAENYRLLPYEAWMVPFKLSYSFSRDSRSCRSSRSFFSALSFARPSFVEESLSSPRSP